MGFMRVDRIVAMVRKLGIKPLVQRTYQGRFFRCVCQLRSTFEVLVGNVELPRAGGLSSANPGMF